MPGYIIVYINNNSIGKDVYFDNIKIEHYNGNTLEENHYYPFGLTLNSTGATGAPPQVYKYNTKELTKDFGLETYEYGARQYDPQLGRFKGLDPLADKYYEISPFAYVANNPVKYIDPDGRFILSSEFREQSKILADYIEKKLKNDVLSSSTIVNGLIKYGQFKDKDDIAKALSNDNGPIINFMDEMPYGADGYYSGGRNGGIYLNKKFATLIKQATNEEELQAALLYAISTLLHETVHYGDNQDNTESDNQDVLFTQVKLPTMMKKEKILPDGSVGDKGVYFEVDVYNRKRLENGAIDNINDAKKVQQREKQSGNIYQILPTLIP